MKRKRAQLDSAYGNKDELLVKTTSLNLSYNRTFGLEHNIIIYQYAKEQSPETIYFINDILTKAIENQKYISLDILKERCNTHREKDDTLT
jgi:hypothetical protein